MPDYKRFSSPYHIARITPDRTVDNKRGHDFTRALHEYMYSPWYKRLSRSRMPLQAPESVWWIVCIKANSMTFHIASSKAIFTFLKQRIDRYWPKAAVEPCDLPAMPSTHTMAAELKYARHDMFSLSADWREDTVPISSVLNVVRDIKPGDECRLAVCMTPYSRTAWADWNQKAHDQFRAGRTPQRMGVASHVTVKSVAKVLDNVMAEIGDIGTAVFSDRTEARMKDLERKRRHRPDMEKREIMLDGRLSKETLQKRNEPVFYTRIYVLSHSDDTNRRKINLRALANAFSELGGDNELRRVEYRGSEVTRIVDRVNRFDAPFTLDVNKMSATETGKFFQLPTASMQEEYAEQLSVIERRETGIPKELVGVKGFSLGEITWRDKTDIVMMPIKNWDELCLPRAVIGGMGTGKTKGFGGNWGAQALAAGFSVFSVDVAKDELGEEIEQGARALGVTDDKFIRLDFGKRAIRLDWREAQYGKRAANRLAGEVLNFFNLHGSEAGIETARYIRLAAKTVGTAGGSLDEMMRLFTDPEYRKRVIGEIKSQRPDLADEWTVYDRLSDGMRGKVTDPILNRLDMLLGDDFLRECFQCDEGIDFVRYMTGGYHVRIFVPKRDLGPEATDILVDFVMSKIELAMFARPEEEQSPAFILCDEPHQFKSCAPRWERMVVESRKWRVGLVFMFHLWDQVPKMLTNSIKAAGAHYHIYTTSKQILRDLAEEIDPYTVEEALKTPTHYAINVIRSGGKTVTPFMAKMAAPPSGQIASKLRDIR